MAHIRARSGDRYWDGGRPVLRKSAVSKLGKSVESQFTAARHAALSGIGPMTAAIPQGDGFDWLEGNRAQMEWLRESGLVELLPPRRPGGARRVVRTAEGERVLSVWNEKKG